MNSSLSFRKESIQRSSHVSEKLSQTQESQATRAGREQKPISLTTLLTLTQ